MAHDIHEKRGVPVSQAIAIAIGVIKRWASGGGNVDATTRAAAARAVAEWERLKASNAAKRGAKAVSESVPTLADELAVRESAVLRLAIFEQQVGREGILELLDPATIMEHADSPERASQVEQLGEMISFDLATAAGVPPVDRLRRAAEARLGVPLAEAFRPGELRDFRGRWRLGGAHHTGGAHIPLSGTDVRAVPASRPARAAAALVPEHRVPGGGSVAKAAGRYEGGVVRSTRKARDKLASMPQIELRDLPKSIGRGIYTPGAEKAAKDIMAGRVLDTEHAHSTMVNGKRVYSRDRKALHQQIVNNLLQGKAEHPGSARAIFTAGGPASGKSGLIKGGSARFERDMHAESPVSLPKDVVHVNPDVVREMLPEYKAMVKAGRTDAAEKTHEEASALAATVMKLATGRQHHVLVDTVGDSEAGKFARKIQRAVDAKMHTEVHYATVPVLTAFERAQKRGEETGRFVEESYLRNAHKNVSLRFPEVIRIKGAHVALYDTSNGSRLMAEKPAGADKLSIRDRVGVTGFLNKGRVRGNG